MPKRKRNSSKRKVVKRARRPRRRRVVNDAFPKTMVTKMKYVDFISLDQGSSDSGIPKPYNFRCNSIFDPDRDGVGHQPLGHDQFNLIYDHYTVIGSKIKCTFTPQGNASQSLDMLYMLSVQDTINTYTNPIDFLEQPKTRGISVVPGYAGKAKVLTATYSPYKMFGLSKKDSLIANPKLTPQFGSNPVEDAFFQISVCNPTTTSANPPPIRVRVEIEYLVVCSERRPLDRS